MNKEKVLELCVNLMGTLPQNYVKAYEEWLEQNQPEPIVVGLSDEQIDHLGRMIERCYGKTWTGYAQSIIANYLKTQTFAQPEVFTPDWKDAPKWANWLAQNFSGAWSWFEEKPDIESGLSTKFKTTGRTLACFDNSSWRETLQQRPKLPPVVDVFQIWSLDGIEYEVSSVGEDEKGNQRVTFRKNVSLDDFLAKFERVS